jgi:hypothetical protein
MMRLKERGFGLVSPHRDIAATALGDPFARRSMEQRSEVRTVSVEG